MYANGNVTQMSILLFYKFIDFCFYFIHSSESKISHIKNNRHKYPQNKVKHSSIKKELHHYQSGRNIYQIKKEKNRQQ